MKLTVFGRDPQQADVVLSSTFVSGYHAELIQLDNGDMYLVDKSSNGTSLNGNKLVPGKETPVRRGDNVMFADVPLNWNLVEDLRMPADVKQVKTIGAHYTSNIKLQGAGVSRFHAALRQMKDGKWYICDYSKNGTTLNGQRLPKNTYMPIKAKDEIVCAGVPVANPIPKKGPGKLIGIILGAVAACALIAVAIIFIPKKWSSEKIYATYNPSVVFMVTGYHFEVECGTLDVSILPDPDDWSRKLPAEFVFLRDEEGDLMCDEYGNLIPVEYNGDNSIMGTATGFFIGEQGYIATNLHVARPWMAGAKSTSSGVKSILTIAEEIYRQKLNDLIDEYRGGQLIQYMSQLQIKGVVDYCAVIPHGNYLDVTNAIRCTEVIVSNDIEADVAIMRLQQNYLPIGATYVPLKKIVDKKLKLGETIYTSGFPYDVVSTSKLDKQQIHVNAVEGQITKNDDICAFLTTAPIAGGASGSPVFNEYGELVGVMHAQIKNKQSYNFGIYSSYLLDLIEKAKITE